MIFDTGRIRDSCRCAEMGAAPVGWPELLTPPFKFFYMRGCDGVFYILLDALSDKLMHPNVTNSTLICIDRVNYFSFICVGGYQGRVALFATRRSEPLILLPHPYAGCCRSAAAATAIMTQALRFSTLSVHPSSFVNELLHPSRAQRTQSPR